MAHMALRLVHMADFPVCFVDQYQRLRIGGNGPAVNAVNPWVLNVLVGQRTYSVLPCPCIRQPMPVRYKQVTVARAILSEDDTPDGKLGDRNLAFPSGSKLL